MRVAIAISMLLGAACGGGGIDDWKGTWTGSADVNTGRLPVHYTGKLVVAAPSTFSLTTDAQGTPAQSWSCQLTATSLDSGKATFAVPSSCTLTVSPADDCQYDVSLTTLTATLSNDVITATGNGHLSSTCTSSSNVSEDFAVMSGTATR